MLRAYASHCNDQDVFENHVYTVYSQKREWYAKLFES